jgi:hypothetical protein
MKHKVSELEGRWLDAAVGTAEGVDFPWFTTNPLTPDASKYSSDWSKGGPIIERERIETQLVPSINLVPPPPERTWSAWGRMWTGIGRDGYQVSKAIVCEGQTILIAAMRAYVASKFGEEVELP